MSSKFLWEVGDLDPGWLQLVSERDRSYLLSLLRTAQRSREERAHQMLASPPWPTDEEDAELRIAAVIRFLRDGYRVGDAHPTMEGE